MPAFHDIRFPTAVSLGAAAGPERRTEIVALASGREERNSPWAHSRRRYDAGYGLRSLTDIEAVVAFFEARRGRLHAFRFRDPLDWMSSSAGSTVAPTDQPLGTGDGAGTEFPLIKRYHSGPAPYNRPIAKPDPSTIRVAIDGVETTSFTLTETDPAQAIIQFDAAPIPGAALTTGFAFDVPARFDADALTINLAAFEAGEIPSIPIIEVRL